MKNLIKFTFVLSFIFIVQNVYCQIDGYNRNKWLEIAKESKPKLIQKIIKPVKIVELVKNDSLFQGWGLQPVRSAEELVKNSFKEINNVILDFGDHYTGYFSFNIGVLSRTPDGPLRFKLTFAEVPYELSVPFDPYTGTISRAWLQDEIITVMNPLDTIKLDRRVSFRYLRIELLASSQYFDFNLKNIQLVALSSAENIPSQLSSSCERIFRQIDKVGLNTLKECMQTVYEDGPKRDQRLWIGDLYLESIANSYSFKNYDLTKRCLYLLAGLTDERGYLYATIFENPYPHSQANQFLMDFSLLYNVTLKEYLLATGDKKTVSELWVVAKKQLEIIYDNLESDGMINYERVSQNWGIHIDWKDNLNKAASIQGLSIYVLKETYELAKLINKQDELKSVPALIKKMTETSHKMYNRKINLFESGNEKQISYASQIWMILGGVLSKEESRLTLNCLIKTNNVVYPQSPYLYHYLVQALINSEMRIEAKKLLTDYWGGMIDKGADTFWEVYDPRNDFLSPYNFAPVNSYCHAWSCTPVYFIRKYPEIFQK